MTYQDFSERFEYDPDDDLLGEGGFGKIYKAWDHVRNEFVAVKTSKVLPDYEEFSLMQEYELVRLLEHPNIARYIDCKRIKFPNTGTHDVALMKYYEYGNLSQLLSNHLLSDPQKQTLIDGLLAGINYLHTQQPIIIHRDLKPSNILVVKRGEKYIPLITDFGISRKAKMNDISFITNTVGAGTYMYAAPEQWEAKELRPNADLWSFGIISAYIWLNGKKLPFRAEDIDVNTETGRMEYKRRLLSLDFAQEINNIPEPYQTVIRKCLVVDPLQRIKTAKEVKALLEGNKQPITVNIPKGKDVSVPIGGDEATKLLPRKDKNPKEVKVSPPEKVTPPEIKPIKRNNERIWYGVVAVGLLLIGLAGWYLKNKEVGSIVLPTTDSTSFNKVKKDTIDSKTSLPTKDANGKPTELVAAAKIETPPKAKETIPEGAVAKTRQTVAKAEIPPSQDNTIYTDVDQVPQYPGGQEALREFLENNLTYPPAASKSYISGKVIVSFIVNTNGNLQDVRVTKSLGYGCDEEALRLVRSMPNWKPGRQDNKVVRVRYSVPVSFILN